ncbi:MAG: efflux RND transporter permease subunit, partial [Pseudoxanthomonas sp.]|nr:efflux RND transporter permease subunit [Pseudoxanthomonas sp.]
ALGIPVCTVAAFIGLLLAGRTVNVISLAGIAFAIGMTLDNAIVVLESIEQARRRGLDRARAAVAGVREVWPAVLASTLTTVLVFAPILFIREEAGQLYSDVAIAIASAILASMLVATVLVPAACARLGFGGQASGPAPGAPTRRRLLASLDRIHGSRRGRIAALAGTVLAAVAVVALLTPPAEYLPEGEESKTFSVMIAPPGYNLAEMARIGERLRADLAPALAPDAVTQPDGLPALAYYNLNVSARNLRIIAEPRDPRDIDALMDALDARFEAFPGMRAFSSRGSIISSNDGGTRSVNLDIAGTDLAQIYRVAELAYRRAEALFDNPRIGSDPGSLSLDQPLVEVRPDWLRLAELGFGAQDFGYAVAALSDGAYVDELILGDDKIDIFLFGAEPGEQSLQRLRTLPVAAPDGSVLPLESLARLDERADTDAIRRVDGRRTVTLNIVPPRSVALETAVARVGEELVAAMQRDGEVPAGVTLDISGAADQLDATRAALSGNFLVAVAICYLLLVAIFGHWGLPLLILVTVPLGMAGGLLGLAALNLVASQPFDMITMLGFLVLLGTVVNNPILIVDRAWQGLHRDGLAAAEAVREAVASRLRPILMTTLTTVFGLAPLVFLPGAGTELYRGLGVVVLSGLVCSTVVTLVFLPSLLVVVLSWRQRAPATAGGA